MPTTRNVNSPLIHAEMLQLEEVIFWDKSRFPEIDAKDDDTPYVVQKGERIDNLAFRQLGSDRLGWVIAVRNNLRLFPNDLVPGEIIYIPSIDGLKRRGVI